MAPAGLPLESQWKATGRPLRDGLLRAVPHLRRLCGEAGAAEVFARGLRVLDVMESSVAAWPLSVNVKVAIVAGVSLKLTQTQADGLVQTLWTSLSCLMVGPAIASAVSMHSKANVPPNHESLDVWGLCVPVP